MADEDNQFLAVGPREPSSDPPSYPDFAAFATAWTDPPFEFGVNVEGQRCGVYASTLHGGDRQPMPGASGAGVYASGQSTGVFGIAREEHGIGVRGRRDTYTARASVGRASIAVLSGWRGSAQANHSMSESLAPQLRATPSFPTNLRRRAATPGSSDSAPQVGRVFSVGAPALGPL